MTMRDNDFREMSAFLAVAEHQSFTKAAEALGISRATLSYTIRMLEERLGVRLLNRTTRSVATTEAGERLLSRLKPLFDEYAATLESINDFRDKPAGQVRLTVAPAAAHSVIAPRLAQFMQAYPDIRLEVSVDSANVDLVAQHFDAGIHVAQHIDRDMIAVRVGEDMQPVVVAAPSYLAAHPAIEKPQDLIGHNCIRFRMADGAMFPWRFQAQDRSIFEVAVSGSLILNYIELMREPVRAGIAVAYLPRGYVAEALAQGAVVPLLQSWTRQESNFFLYYPSRRQTPAALKVLIDFLRAPVGNPAGAAKN